MAALALLRLRDREGAETARRFVAADLPFGCDDLGLTPFARDSHDKVLIRGSILDACIAHILVGVDNEGRRSPE